MSRLGAAPGIEGEEISRMEEQIPEMACKKCTCKRFPLLAVPFLAAESWLLELS